MSRRSVLTPAARRVGAGLFALGALLASPGAALAAGTGVQACAGTGPTTTVVRDGSWLESSAFDPVGQLLYTDVISGKITALGAPGGPRRSLGRVALPGGMRPTADGRMALASGNTYPQLIGGASVYLLDTATGAKTRIASRLVGANGLAHDVATGTTYTSDELDSRIDRVGPGGAVTLKWWRGAGAPNGLALSADGRTLYANLSGTAKVIAIDTATGATRTVYRVPGLAPLPDGLAIDDAGRLYLALYFAGEVLRLDPSTGVACRLARGLTLPTSVAIPPAGGAFDAASVYVTQWGAVKRIAAAVPVAAAG